MPSSDFGKDYIVNWIRTRFPTDAEILDVGACDGKWRNLLHDYPNMDAIEIFPPNAEYIRPMYREVINADVYDVQYRDYDLIIFGDVIEHMTVERAQAVLEYAKGSCKDMIVGVPYEYKQGKLYGNPWEEHIQDDLTDTEFVNRYRGFKPIITTWNYGYYHKEINQ